ncbi:MAG: amino acid adenylation domain-containing protein [Myxococcaceae bacterium]
MVPSHVEVLDQLPLTASGKVDRKALADFPIEHLPRRSVVFDPPRGPTEELVAELFSRLLGVSEVGREDDFFRLGGHSLSAIQLVARIRKTFNVDLPVSAVFSAPTVARLAERIDTAPALAQAEVGLISRARPERTPASLVQERLWYALQLPAAPPYVITTGLLLEGSLDVERLERALQAVVERNETLRSTFYAEGNTVYVQTGPAHRPLLSRVDLTHLAAEQALQEACDHLERRSHEHLDLARGPLYRFELLRLDPPGRRHVLALSLSHLVVDGIGVQVLLEQLSTAFQRAGAGSDVALLPPAALQYADFALHQRQAGYLARLEQQLESWKQRLANAPPVIDLPTDAPRRAQPLNANMRTVPLRLGADHARGLRELASNAGVSLFAAALALMDVWLHRLSGQSKVVVAANVSGRTLPETESMVGYFTNLVPLCSDVSGEPSFRQMLRRAHETIEHASANQEVPYKRIADAVHSEADRAALPLAQTLLMLDEAGGVRFDGLAATPLEHPSVIPAYDLILAFEASSDGRLSGSVCYDSALFTDVTARRFAAAFEQLFASAVHAPEAPISRLALLSSAQREEVLAALRGPREQVAKDACIHALFEAQVARTPDAPAVSWGDATWSYAELNARANCIARELVSMGLPPESRVGVVMDPSTQAMAVLLGILKAGCAYVPVDPTWPEQRKRAVLERAGVEHLFVDPHHLESHRTLARNVAVPHPPERVRGELAPGPRQVSPTQLAYIVFTSGSTGEPKGVMVQHASVVNHNLAIAKRFGLRQGDRMLQFAPLSFDAAAEDLYPPLAVGATVVMKNGLVPAHAMTPYLEQEGITIISLPPTYIEEWVREMEANGQRVPKALHLLAPGGDVLRKQLWEAWVRVGGEHAPWVNVYGPTECTITSATCDIPGPEGIGEAPTFPIGRPLPNVHFYLLDDHMEPVLPGLPGKVFIGGAALARGYLNAPDQTARVFIPDPWAGTPGARMYDTGDLARLEPDGRLRFLGRADHQVKIRGFRVELSEIEGCLRRQEGVTEAVVMARKAPSGVQQLCAWVEAQPTVKSGHLREALAAQLPGYMVPADIVVLEALPVNANGKVDRQALPAPESISAAADEAPSGKPTTQVVPWRNTLEMLLARIWTEVLGKAPSGIDDDFFQAGGDSILAMRLLARIEDEIRVPIPLATVFQNPVLRELAVALGQLMDAGEPTSTLVRLSTTDVPEDAPVLFFIHPGDGEVFHYRFLAEIVGSRYRCFAVQAPETLTSRTFASLDERIEAYVRDLREVQPEGPYRIVTYSYGAYPALGVAKALEAAGQRVSLLAFFDTYTDEQVRKLSGPDQENPWYEMAAEFAVLDDAFRAQLDAASVPERWELIAARGRELGTLAPHVQGSDIARTWHVLGEVLVPEARRWSVPTDVRAPILLFASEATAALGDPTLGWGKYIPREQMRIVPFPGTHFTAIRPPDVNDLGPILLEALEAAER